jgi:hypothetical protein
MSTKVPYNRTQSGLDNDNAHNGNEEADAQSGEKLEPSYQVCHKLVIHSYTTGRGLIHNHQTNSYTIRMRNWESMGANITREKSNYKPIAVENGIHADFAMTT